MIPAGLTDVKTVLGLLAVGMTAWAHIPYLIETLRGTNRPHVFTWVIWSLLTFIAFAAQWTGQAGPGAWVTGMTGLFCVVILIAALRQGEKQATRSDWAMFLCGLTAIPLWLVTKDPLGAVLIVVAIDCCAFYPTFRKSWHRPFAENTFMYGLNIPRHLVALAALRVVSPVTALYPAALLLMNAVMYAMLKIRRKRLAPEEYL